MQNRLIVPSGMSRRHFLGHLATTAMALPASQFFSALQAREAAGSQQKRCIVLWMGGGPSHMDTWDLKPESEKNGGEFRPIETSAPGVQICEHLPTIATQMKHLSVIRSLNSKEGNHDRGTYMMHTGYAPNPTIVHPSFGSACSYELGHKAGEDFPLPHAIAINSPGEGAGFLGMAHSPFFVSSPTADIANMKLPSDGSTTADAWSSRRRVWPAETWPGGGRSQIGLPQDRQDDELAVHAGLQVRR